MPLPRQVIPESGVKVEENVLTLWVPNLPKTKHEWFIQS
jgi:hypothetical protein